MRISWLLFLFSFKIASAHVFAEHPMILVHGYGPQALVGLNKLKRYLSDGGMSSRHIHLVNYPHNANITTLSKKLANEFKKVFEKYPPATRFDVIAHSLGDFTALYTALQYGFSDRISYYIGLAGVAHGQDLLPAFCPVDHCGETTPLLIPSNNPFLTKLYSDHAIEMQALAKCSLYSPDDKMADAPVDSGTFTDGINVSVPGFSHMDFIHKSSVVEILKQTCYQNGYDKFVEH